jgi:hypothetical protein
MKEILTDIWALQQPEEWFAEQDDETIVISDTDEVSVIEITTIKAESDDAVDQLLKDVAPKETYQTTLSELDALYYEMAEDGMAWREWLCPLDDALLIISHGCDEENKGFDDSAVDEILSTLIILDESPE